MMTVVPVMPVIPVAVEVGVRASVSFGRGTGAASSLGFEALIEYVLRGGQGIWTIAVAAFCAWQGHDNEHISHGADYEHGQG